MPRQVLPACRKGGTLLPGLGTGATLRAGLIDMLALEQFKADQKHRAGTDHFHSTLETLSPRSTEQWLREADANLVAHWSATARRREQARHNGMLVCRVFFKSTSVSALMPDKFARFTGSGRTHRAVHYRIRHTMTSRCPAPWFCTVMAGSPPALRNTNLLDA